MATDTTQRLAPTDPSGWGDLKWRLVGPFRAGRVVAVAGHPVDQATFYFGSTGGGVWKTTDVGRTWSNISDGFFKRASVGGIAVSESDPNVIYAGMGEGTIRGNVSHGDGVYKSTDGGATWANVGLSETRNIGRVRVHPTNPDVLYVAVLGHAHGPNRERGVFRSKDGGKTWEQVLFRSEQTGAIDLTIDAHNPRVIYAAFWQAKRTPYSLESGGEECGIWRSLDGGDTWTDITRNPGLPAGLLGKIGVSASPAQAGCVYALIEAEDGAVFKSTDRGDTWQRMNESRELRQRPWYFNHIFADPTDSDTLWVLNFYTWKSTDGGKTFDQMPTPHADNHDLWIDPNNPRRIIIGHDGGASVSLNGGETWSDILNQPTVEFYHVTTDMQTPYRIYGAQQDNTTISVSSRSNYAAITQADWTEVGGGESGYIAVRPDDPNIIFAGSYGGVITRYDHRTGQRRSINVWPEAMTGHGAKDVKYRFQWTYPITLSPHDPDTLYITSNIVHRTRDEGNSWENVSPDLTRNDVTKMEPSGGVVTRDNTGAEYYGTIFAFTESPVQQGVLWAGSDDGLVHVSQNGGESWQNVTPPDLPEWALISIIEASPHDAGNRVRRGHALQVGRFRALSVQDQRFRQHLDQNRGRHTGERFHARHPRGSRAEGSSLRRHRDRPLCFVRRWLELAALSRESAGSSNSRPGRERFRPDPGDPRSLLLGARRRHPAASGARQRRKRRHPLPTAHDGPLLNHQGLRRRSRQREQLSGCRGLARDLQNGGREERRQDTEADGCRRKPGGRRDGALLPARASGGRGNADVPGRERQRDPHLLQQSRRWGEERQARQEDRCRRGQASTASSGTCATPMPSTSKEHCSAPAGSLVRSHLPVSTASRSRWARRR